MSNNNSNNTIKKLTNSLIAMRNLTSLDFLGTKDQFKLTKSQREVLFAIGHNQGLPMKNVWKDLGVTKGNVSIVTDVLVKTKFITRKYSTKDRRIVNLYLKKKGEVAVEEYNRLLIERYETVFSRLSQYEQDEFRTGMDVNLVVVEIMDKENK